MIRLFSFFVDWCAGHGLNPVDYRIVIVPKTPRAEAHFMAAWDNEFAHLTWDRPNPRELREGFMFGVPFKIAENEVSKELAP